MLLRGFVYSVSRPFVMKKILIIKKNKKIIKIYNIHIGTESSVIRRVYNNDMIYNTYAGTYFLKSREHYYNNALTYDDVR